MWCDECTVTLLGTWANVPFLCTVESRDRWCRVTSARSHYWAHGLLYLLCTVKSRDMWCRVTSAR